MRIITVVFEEKTMLELQDKNFRLQECLYLQAFLKDFDDNNGRREMAHYENVNISKDVWQKWATHEIIESMDAPKFEYFLGKYEDS